DYYCQSYDSSLRGVLF
nr:immunoglobulin light chain junction region [Macaca mulatta]MOV69844.1 immunoglobulin light chain junction region [Macaca mulatta]MOV70910.1 immunoglobulin light chain junction region [Macaca mulatta]